MANSDKKHLCPRCPKVGREGVWQNIKSAGQGYCRLCATEYNKTRNAFTAGERKNEDIMRKKEQAHAQKVAVAREAAIIEDVKREKSRRAAKYWADMDAEFRASGDYMETPDGLVKKSIANGGLLAE